MAQFHFDPDSYLELMAEEVPDYARLQEEAAAATVRARARPPEVSWRHPDAALVGVDASEAMLSRARDVLPDADLRVARLEGRSGRRAAPVWRRSSSSMISPQTA